MEAPELERRLAAIFAADVEGYSRLMHRDEEATMATLSARRATVDQLIALHRGRIANTAGDSILAEFASVLDAVSCAVEVQTAMESANAADTGIPMQFRIGINVGDVMVKDGDIFGDGVNVAARLEGLADGGGICVSRGVRDHLRHRTSLVFEDLGEQLVKNIAHPIRAYRLRREQSNSASEPLEMAERELLAEHTAASEHDGLVDADTGDDALDLAFWESIKDSDRPEELEAYLQQHPDGHFAALARTRLARGPEETPSEHIADAIELAFWEGVRDAADAELLAAYLDKYPGGEFTVIAQARLLALQAAS